ncbi:hypothetical protein [Streptomyces sp. NBC_00470]|uniref:hypothetical protein n=1 Tax=Streptomyces sp. NBC_00470 TaxID=2975753 RepID=UPI002F911507
MDLRGTHHTYQPLPSVLTRADIAQVTGLSRTRITQLYAPDRRDLPEPDAEESTPKRPRWKGDTIARWCAQTGRRLPPRTASWLLPGPDGPHLHRADQFTLHLRQSATPADVTPSSRHEAIDVHVARYAAAPGRSPALWLATVLEPNLPAKLLRTPRWQHGSPLGHLLHDLLGDLPHEREDSDPSNLLGTLVLLPTEGISPYGSSPASIHLLDLFAPDATRRTDDSQHDWLAEIEDRTRQLPVQHPLMQDLTTAIGHRLPWWPAHCATPALVATWQPGKPTDVPVPPAAAGTHHFQERCHATAQNLEGDLARSLRTLGTSAWATASRDWRPGRFPDLTALPEACDPEVWEVAVRITLDTEPPAHDDDFWDGLEWLMEHSPSQRLARDAHAMFRDPGSAHVVVLDTSLLPEAARHSLTSAVIPAGPSLSLRAQLVLDALEGHPSATTNSRLGHWPAPAGPLWCATAPANPLIALHIPRKLPNPAKVGAPLEAIVMATHTDPDSYRGPDGIVWVTTERDCLTALPEFGDASHLAAAIEHTIWHPGQQVLTTGLQPSINEPLIRAVETLLGATPRSTPWNHLADLVGTEPDGDCYYCHQPAPQLVTTK